MEVLLTKVSTRLNFLTTKMRKLLVCLPRLFIPREPRDEIPAAEVNRQIFLVRHSAECTFYGKITVIFLTCYRHLLSGVTLRILFYVIDNVFIISVDAAKSFRFKFREAILYVRKIER